MLLINPASAANYCEGDQSQSLFDFNSLSPSEIEFYRAEAFNFFAEEVGIDSREMNLRIFDRLWSDIQRKVNADHMTKYGNYYQRNALYDPMDCLKEYGREWLNNEDRIRALSCIAIFSTESLTDQLLSLLISKRQKLLQNVSPESVYGEGRSMSINDLKSLKLIAFIEDLVFSRRVIESKNKNQGSNWYVVGQGWKNYKTHYDFPYENGDIVLSFGSSSISTIISQITLPQSRYSHAFYVGKEAESRYTVEALIETGVKRFEFDEFKSHTYNRILVLRLKNKDKRDQMLQCAKNYIDTPYDEEMDINNHNKIFCAELVAACLSEVLNKSITEVIPQTSYIPNQAASFANLLGVKNQLMTSPGDLLSSQELEIVAQYRRSENLLSIWQRYISGYLFMRALKYGARVKPSIGLNILGFFAGIINNLVPGVRLTPEAISARALPFLGVMEHKLFRPSLHFSNGYLEHFGYHSRNLLETNFIDVVASIIAASQNVDSIKGSLEGLEEDGTVSANIGIIKSLMNMFRRNNIGDFFACEPQ
ncbi:MAG: hypothetical protein KDD58_15590 [Bdellovibrionales bacterium]|nr:hypothetical protein [Bdellovibrionales bacterium]